MLRAIAIILLLTNCSFDDKTGIWTGESKTIAKKKQNTNIKPVFEKQGKYLKNVNLLPQYNLILNKNSINQKWNQRYLNNANNFGNINFYNKGEYKKFSKISKYSINENILFSNNYLIYSDVKGNIGAYSLKQNRNLFKYNFYKKKFKKIQKKISLVAEANLIYAADNLGYAYCLDLKKNKLVWAKNFQIPFRSNIKIFNNFIFLADEKNKIILLNKNNGNKVDELYTQPAKTVSIFENNLAIDKKGNLLLLNTNGNLYSVNLVNNKVINWVRNLNTEDQVIFNAMPLLVSNEKILITTNDKISLYNTNGIRAWELNINSSVAPVKSGNYIFALNKDNYLMIIEEGNGKIIFSQKLNNIFSEKFDRKYQKKIKEIKHFFVSNKKIFLISENSYLLEMNVGQDIKISSIRKKPFSVASDVLNIKDKLILLSEKKRVFQIY